MVLPNEVVRDIFAFSVGNDFDDLPLVNRQFSAIVSRFYSINRPIRRMFSLDVDFSSFSTIQYEHRIQSRKSFVDFKALTNAIRKDPIEIANIRLYNLQDRYRFRDENVKEREGITHLVRLFNVQSVKFIFRANMPFFKLVRENDHIFIKRLKPVKENSYGHMVRILFNKQPRPSQLNRELNLLKKSTPKWAKDVKEKKWSEPAVDPTFWHINPVSIDHNFNLFMSPFCSESYFLSIPHGIQCNKIELDADSIDVRISDNFIRSGHIWQSGQSSLIAMNRYLFQQEPEELVDNLLMAFHTADVRSNFTIVVKKMDDLAEFSIAPQFNQRIREKFETSMLSKDEIDDTRIGFSGSGAEKYWVIRRSPMDNEL